MGKSIRKMRLQLHNEEDITTINERLTYQFNMDDELKFPLKDPVVSLMSLHSAWYAGDPNLLHSIYQSMVNQVGGSTKESFWSKRIEDGLLKVHVPLAADIASASADILFSEMPDVVIPEAEEELKLARQKAEEAEEALKAEEAALAPPIMPEGEEDATEDPEAPPIALVPPPRKPSPATIEPIVPTGPATRTQERLDEILENSGFESRLLEAAEACAAIGGVYLVPTWDISLSKYPILAINQADLAIPEFKWGMLVAVTFYKLVYENQDVTYRHMERHEVGAIHNGLFAGGKHVLGKQVPLTERHETKDLTPTINTEWDGLMVRYIPNMKPNRRFRGSAHGQSDYAGVEPLMDALDEVYTSWMRDIRLARARIIVPESFLDFDDVAEQKKPYFNIDKAVYTAMAMDPLTAKDAGMTLHQFAIRAKEHKETVYELLERIVTHAGYSPQTFGLRTEGQAESGTALNARERKTFVTRLRKWKYWKQPLEDVLEMMLHIDNVFLGNGTEVFRPSITLVDAMSKDLASLSTVLQALHNAEAVSLDTKVRLLHPDWSEEAIRAEIELIKDEIGGAAGVAVADPTIPNPLAGDTGDSDIGSEPDEEDEEIGRA